MLMEISTLPKTELLEHHLSKLFSDNGTGEKVEIISRSAFMGSSTFLAEMINCKFPGGKVLTLFGKYLAGMAPNKLGHRGGSNMK